MPVTRTVKRVTSISSARIDESQPELTEPETDQPSTSQRSPPPSTPLFPCTSSTTARRPSHHKKRPPSHIPRPPNAFILFRANFIRDRHLQASTDGPLSNVSPTALSTIVGMTWKNLPDEERQVWIEKARIAREEHKILHPTYRYQPLPTAEERAFNRENKRKIKEENLIRPDMERCSLISSLLVQGHRGQELEEKVAEFDRARPPPLRSNASNGSAAMRLSHPMTRSTSLPTPPRRRATRRPRASSTSDSLSESHTGPSTMLPENLVTTASYILPADSRQHIGAEYAGSGMSGYATDSAMPDLTYDPASPSSINLPELQDGAYLPTMSTVGPSTYHHPHSHFSSPITHSFNRTSNSSVPTTDHFSSFSSWDGHQQLAEPYHQFSYFTPMHEPPMVADTHAAYSAATNIVDPYASSIPPFQLYHTLKPFEQPFCGLSADPEYIHAIEHDFTTRYHDA